MYGIIDGFDIVIGNPPYDQIQKFSGQQIQKDWASQNYKTFAKTGDIYSLFYERGNMLLKKSGTLAFITSNKWMRANYGKATRKYFAEKTIPLTLIDFGGYKVFESATVDANILIFKKGNEKQQNRYRQACITGKDFTNTTDIAKYIEDNGVTLDNLTEESWIISSKEEYAIKKRIEEIGTPLKDWDVSIYRGILTGFNEAFIISGEKKDELIAQDPRSAEIIKPILRGRDIKKYKVEFANLWLINSHNGYLDNGTQERVPPIDIDDYPAIKDHLDNYWENIDKRQDKGITPYNLRNCAYLTELEREKVVYPETTVGRSEFYFCLKNYYVEKTCFFIIGQNLKYLNSMLASKTIEYFLEGTLRVLGKTSIQYSKQYIVNLPIPKITKEKQLHFELLVDCILFAKEHNLNLESDTFESVIDGMVYDLYFEEEMKKAHCYITDRITEVIKPFKEDDTGEFKTEYIKKLHKFCNEDKKIFHGLIHRRNIKVVEIINGAVK